MFINKERDRIRRYNENAERVYYRRGDEYLNFSRFFERQEWIRNNEVVIDKNSGLEKFTDSESGHEILNAFSEKQLQAGVDSAPVNPEDDLINTHINFTPFSDVTFTKGIDVTDRRNVEIINADRNKKVFGGDSVKRTIHTISRTMHRASSTMTAKNMRKPLP